MRRFVAAVVLLLLVGCRRPPAESTKPEFAKSEDRIEWMEDAISGGAPSKILDAHFRDFVDDIEGSHMMPGYTKCWFWARIEIDPADAPKWVARTQEVAPPRWTVESAPIIYPASWGMPKEEFAGVTWYDPTPLFPPGAHPSYEAGWMAINAAGSEVYVWQYWR